MSLYGGALLEHVRHPRNRGALSDAETIGDAVNPLCGDVIELSLTIDSGRIAAAGFVADACAVCIAAASFLTDRLRGLDVASALRLTTDEVVVWLGVELPEARRPCAGLPLNALHRALGAPPLDSGRSGITGIGVTGIVLAAGLASRFGRDKLGAVLRGEPIIRRAVRALIGSVDHVIVVVGAHGAALREALDGIEVEIVVNERSAEGMSHSLRAGIAAAAEARAVIVALGDQPGISPRVPRTLIAAWRTSHRPIVAPAYAGARGHPVLFDRCVLDELGQLEGDVGARQVIERDPARVVLVDVPGPMPRDVDTEADLAALH